MKLYRPATVLVGILFVLLGGVARLADPDEVYDEPSRTVTSGSIGEPLNLGSSQVTITRVRFAKSYIPAFRTQNQKPKRTNGIFVAVEYDAVPGVRPVQGGFNTTLTTDGGSIYQPAGGTANEIRFPAAGFAQNGAVVFETNPMDLKGLTLRAHPTQLYTVLGQDLAVDLGIPSEEIAQQLVDGAATEYQQAKADVRVAS